jgi:hypothetical protein
VAVERAMRVLVLLVLAFAAWMASRAPEEARPARTSSNGLVASLTQWTSSPPSAAHAMLDTAPDRIHRAWLRALRRAGTAITWSGDSIPALAVEAAPVASPTGGWRLWIAAPRGARVAVADDIAPLDTVVATAGGAHVLAPVVAGALTAAVGRQRASAGLRDSLLARRLLVLGSASWEAKFVISALEEAGWGVDARLSVAPGVEVTQGFARVPDTARHAAVIVLSAPSSQASSAIARYVRGGGGVILSGAAASGALGEIAAGRVGSRTRPASVAFADNAPRQALGFLSIVPRADAIVLEERGGRVAAAVRRLDQGRVLQLGYDETWRWRLAGGAHAVEAHRSWWTTLVASVAYRAAVPVARVVPDDDAPLARLIDAVGPPREAPSPRASASRWVPSPWLLFAIISALLVAELASRRLRGAP